MCPRNEVFAELFDAGRMVVWIRQQVRRERLPASAVEQVRGLLRQVNESLDQAAAVVAAHTAEVWR